MSYGPAGEENLPGMQGGVFCYQSQPDPLCSVPEGDEEDEAEEGLPEVEEEEDFDEEDEDDNFSIFVIPPREEWITPPGGRWPRLVDFGDCPF